MASLELLCALASVVTLAASPARPSPAPTAPSTPPAAASAPAEPEHWAITLRNRVLTSERLFPIVDRLTLVPDTATYLDELSKWSPAGRWPVLIEDEHFAPLFARAFAPKQLVRRAPIGTPTLAGDELKRQLDALAAPATQPNPPGVAYADCADPAWTAAIALALGRNIPLRWLEGDAGSSGQTLEAPRATALRDALHADLDALGVPWRALGDSIETITICRDLSGRVAIGAVRATPIGSTSSSAPAAAGAPDPRAGTIATTDFLGRLPDNSIAAFTGWIFGDASRAASWAMSSLFLPRRDATLASGYADSGAWALYDVRPAETMLRDSGARTQLLVDRAMTPAGWRRSLERGWPGDLAFINSGGNADWFIVADSQQLRVGDLPLFDRPTALHMVHSWSLRSPAQRSTVGGRLLEHGAFLYVGSVEEPFLSAFVPPKIVAERLLGGVPMLVAARHWDGPAALPWRVQTLGDPLMPWLTAALDPRVRIEPSDAFGPDAAAGRVDLRERVKSAMRSAVAEKSDAAAAEALRILRMLGDDDIASQFYEQVALLGPPGPAASAAVLPALFRLGDARAFLAAWPSAQRSDPLLLDMLWQLVPGRMTRAQLPEALATLATALRQPAPEEDAIRLVLLAREQLGAEQATRLATSLEARIPDAAGRKRFRDATK